MDVVSSLVVVCAVAGVGNYVSRGGGIIALHHTVERTATCIYNSGSYFLF